MLGCIKVSAGYLLCIDGGGRPVPARVCHFNPAAALQVGSGTDPVEGAALAKAILNHLAGKARMTMATTHHAGARRCSCVGGRAVPLCARAPARARVRAEV